MTKPLIGINPYCFNYNDATWNGTKVKYYQAVSKGGGVPVTLHYPTGDISIVDIVQRIDGLMMVGGDDIPPETYNSQHPELVIDPPLAPEREAFDRAIVQATIKAGKPVLAICVGLQHINVIHGGTLYEDINTLIPNHINHGVFNGPWIEHDVELKKSSLVASIMGTTSPSVASTHHQGIRELGEGLIATGKSSDGLIEAVESEQSPDLLVAVQWHPELLIERVEHLSLFKWLSSKASKQRLH
ncbi:MAG: gamma-glutamyl-gamma-aminobutyrate hydrolase family protein [Candidatus Marinimicrobia bacterium]|nr:gamma-glutamyl-gamma-aminobutyrate hydrolase family protein [Candidatus Neomarinimicrobiota bacterium]